jgi:hypothetical protein
VAAGEGAVEDVLVVVATVVLEDVVELVPAATAGEAPPGAACVAVVVVVAPACTLDDVLVPTTVVDEVGLVTADVVVGADTVGDSVTSPRPTMENSYAPSTASVARNMAVAVATGRRARAVPGGRTTSAPPSRLTVDTKRLERTTVGDGNPPEVVCPPSMALQDARSPTARATGTARRRRDRARTAHSLPAARR